MNAPMIAGLLLPRTREAMVARLREMATEAESLKGGSPEYVRDSAVESTLIEGLATQAGYLTYGQMDAEADRLEAEQEVNGVNYRQFIRALADAIEKGGA